MNWKTIAKQILLRGIDIFGLNRFVRWKKRRHLLVLAYHTIVSDDSPIEDKRTNVAVTVSQFEEQLRHLKKYWTPVSSKQILQNTIPLPDNAVFVTFDDGFKNNLTLAAPLLKKYEIPAAVFVTTNYIGTQGQVFPALELLDRMMDSDLQQVSVAGKIVPLPKDIYLRYRAAQPVALVVSRRMPLNEQRAWLEHLRSITKHSITAPWHKELYDFLTWDEVRTLRQQGIEIGCHTLSHPCLAGLSPDELDKELRESKAKIEQELGEKCDFVAYPFGGAADYSEAVIAKAAELGFRIGFTLLNCRNEETLEPFTVHRICITRDLTLPSFRALISGIRHR